MEQVEESSSTIQVSEEAKRRILSTAPKKLRECLDLKIEK